MRALREVVGPESADYVHWGATSQDIVDSAAMLVSERSLRLILAELDRVAVECANLAEKHRATLMVARTLLQQAVPTTFGLKAAGWLVAIVDARARLVQVRDTRLAAQLGGAAGTLAALGDRGLDVLRLFAAELELPEPPLPWHTTRGRVAELGQALAQAAGVVAKIGLDLALLAQTEVAEIRESPGSGGSSTMPQKRNPIGSVIAIACARQACACADVLTEGSFRSTSAQLAPGRPSGARSQVRSARQGEPLPPSPRASRGSKSTRRACAPISRRARRA